MPASSPPPCPPRSQLSPPASPARCPQLCPRPPLQVTARTSSRPSLTCSPQLLLLAGFWFSKVWAGTKPLLQSLSRPVPAPRDHLLLGALGPSLRQSGAELGRVLLSGRYCWMDLPGLGYSKSRCEATFWSRTSLGSECPGAWGLGLVGRAPPAPSWVGEGHHTPASRALKAPDLCLCLCCHHR